jgi:hypothetical protein
VLVPRFIAWKLATGFVLTAETWLGPERTRSGEEGPPEWLADALDDGPKYGDARGSRRARGGVRRGWRATCAHRRAHIEMEQASIGIRLGHDVRQYAVEVLEEAELAMRQAQEVPRARRRQGRARHEALRPHQGTPDSRRGRAYQVVVLAPRGALMPPPIPPITDPELIEAVSALTRAAESYRQAFFLLAQRLLTAGGGDNTDFRYVMNKGEDALHLSDAVINAWRMQLGHDKENDELPT